MTTEPKEQDKMALLVTALGKRRVRLNQWQKDYAKAMGWPLRGRGRRRKKA